MEPDEARGVARGMVARGLGGRRAVQAMGASAPEVEVSVEKKYFPQAKDERGLMEAVFTAKAVGRP